MDQAESLITTGRTKVARPILAAVRELAPPQPRLTSLFARLEMKEGNLSTALNLLDRDISAWPKSGGLQKLRAELKLQMNDLQGALRDAADCVLQDKEDPAAKALLGMLLLESGQASDAILCLGEAFQDCPNHPGIAQALSAALEASGEVEAAYTVLQSCLAATPGSTALHSAAIMLSVRNRDFLAVIDIAQKACRHGAADACVFGLLGHALSSLGRHEEAADAYQEALKLGPDDPYVRHLVAASGSVASAARAPENYVRAVFDGYSERFEKHLLGLRYRVPGLVRAALLRHRPKLLAGHVVGPVLDLGCGTGLIGVVVSDLAISRLVGVDISSRMLDVARRKGVYADLFSEDIERYLRGSAESFPVIIASDVLCYFGDISQLLMEICSKLTVEGLFLFSVEILNDGVESGSWKLGRQGRFGHSRDYVINCANTAGLAVREIRQEVLRQEAGVPVTGLLLVLERTA